ncbi:hypothetical protein HII36_07770 [Nonomuraea sp. NN258]|uniref:hypothetical protein n=1 Tax=Nonomuraea antri TaxID=2730852 RepID=UPI00156A5F1F|nr:hypothetical protein [Nonomuraea antri]NRQ31735.1 hypothetical protein [Nonomuraea antri]
MRRIVPACLLVLALASCSDAGSQAGPTSAPVTSSSAAREQPPPAPRIEPEAMAEYDASAEHSPNLVPVAALTRTSPFDTHAAVGSDLAFTGDYAIAGNYEGFTIYDISQPERPAVVSQVRCPGPQNDVTVSGNLLFLSVDLPMDGPGCDSTTNLRGGEDWEGLRIFDIADKRNPRYVGAVDTPCGSHTATLAPGTSPDVLHLYATSSPGRVGGTECVDIAGRISVVRVPVADPAKASLVANALIMPDGGTKPAADMIVGGCHDITVYAPKRLAAASCLGDGLILDVSDPVHPKVLDRVQDKENFAYWHSAVFSADGSKVVFSDEFGAGRSTECDPKTGGKWGANGVYDLAADGKLTLRGHFKIPRKALAPKTCSAHNGSLVPVTGRDVMVQGWYEGGVSVIDFTDPERAEEVAWFQRGRPPVPDADVPGGVTGGSWAAYYYNGYIYSSDMFKGLDVLKLTGLPLREQRLTEFNPQTQF